ncbi:hypothetical protein IVB03_09395 [Bradyrhizobium sp. 168]|uniref:hypothetical protein n=1 Tax=Bradyrhizobium sp. 168 TaxID=2782639 RepID=UPI001FF92B2E|nr:hypothetical protein [Bradyrhizobium sp. 168]MCK1579777.1 hypothetical protein [Bradyrhizobium sp. 168]
MSAIRIAIILSLMTPVFTGKVAAQNVGQSDLCALEARSTATMAAANAQTQAEKNPLRRSELGQAANKIANDVIRARLDFFGTKYGVLNSGEIHNMEGSRPFTGFTGKIRRFSPHAGPTSFILEIVLECPQPSYPIVLAAQIEAPIPLYATTPWISSLPALRQSLLQTNIGSSVIEFSGTIFIMVSPRSPAIDQGGTMYWIKVVALKNKIGADGECTGDDTPFTAAAA